MEEVKKRKQLQDFLKEDKSLLEKISYEEYLAKKSAPNNSDEPLDKTYRKYREIIEGL